MRPPPVADAGSICWRSRRLVLAVAPQQPLTTRGHRFELRFATLSITLLSLCDISPNRGIPCLRRQKTLVLRNESFFIHCESNGISSAAGCISSTRQRRVVSHHTFRRVSKSFRNDDIQNFVLMICNSLRNWWYTMLRIDFSPLLCYTDLKQLR